MSSRALTAARQFNKTQVCQVVDKIWGSNSWFCSYSKL
jgi:hypothetical protein